MTVYCLQRYRATGDPAAAPLSEEEVAELIDALEWDQQCSRIRYDHQASGLRQLGVEPSEVLGPRP